MKPEIKKLLILNAPYLLFVYLFDKVGQAVRLAPRRGYERKAPVYRGRFFPPLFQMPFRVFTPPTC